MSQTSDRPPGSKVVTLAERLRAQGFEKGFQQGFQQGFEQGFQQELSEFLLRQLKTKFHAVDDELRERVRGATPDEIFHWGERMLTAGTLDEVFS